MIRFEVGDYIKCIEDVCEENLTINKTYKVIEYEIDTFNSLNSVIILNDIGDCVKHFDYRFELDRVAIRQGIINNILE